MTNNRPVLLRPTLIFYCRTNKARCLDDSARCRVDGRQNKNSEKGAAAAGWVPGHCPTHLAIHSKKSTKTPIILLIHVGEGNVPSNRWRRTIRWTWVQCVQNCSWSSCWRLVTLLLFIIITVFHVTLTLQVELLIYNYFACIQIFYTKTGQIYLLL